MKKVLNIIFDIIFCIIILFLIKEIIPFNIISYGKIIIYILVMIFIYKKISKIKIEKYMFIILFAIILIMQIISANLFKVIPSWDFGAVWAEAKNFSLKINNKDYFYMYPNNIPIMVMLKTIFYICKLLHITNTINIGIAINIISIDLSIFMLVLVIKEILGKEKAFFTLFFIFLMPIIYLAVPIFYTDTLSMPFPIIMIYIYLKLREEQSKNKKILYSILLGVITIIGMNIKITVGITFIAIIIYEIFLCKKQKIINILYPILTLITIVVLILLEMLIFKFLIEDLERLQNERLPTTHYIMMALNDNGSYRQQDLDFTRLFKTKEEKINANIKEIKIRIKKYDTLDKLIKFIKTKERKVWKDGTYYMPSLLMKFRVKEGKIQDLIYKNNDAYIEISTLQREVLMVLMLISIFYKKNKKGESINIIARLSILGLIIFLSFWEINSRYLINYIPILTLIEILGIDVIGGSKNGWNQFKFKKYRDLSKINFRIQRTSRKHT